MSCIEFDWSYADSTGIIHKLAEMDDIVLLTVADAAKLMQVSRHTVYRMIKSGDLETRNVGNVKRIPAGSIRRVLRGKSPCPQPAAEVGTPTCGVEDTVTDGTLTSTQVETTAAKTVIDNNCADLIDAGENKEVLDAIDQNIKQFRMYCNEGLLPCPLCGRQVKVMVRSESEQRVKRISNIYATCNWAEHSIDRSGTCPFEVKMPAWSTPYSRRSRFLSEAMADALIEAANRRSDPTLGASRVWVDYSPGDEPDPYYSTKYVTALRCCKHHIPPIINVTIIRDSGVAIIAVVCPGNPSGNVDCGITDGGDCCYKYIRLLNLPPRANAYSITTAVSRGIVCAINRYNSEMMKRTLGDGEDASEDPKTDIVNGEDRAEAYGAGTLEEPLNKCSD